MRVAGDGKGGRHAPNYIGGSRHVLRVREHRGCGNGTAAADRGRAVGVRPVQREPGRVGLDQPHRLPVPGGGQHPTRGNSSRHVHRPGAARRSTGPTRTCRGCCSPRPARPRTSRPRAPSSRACSGIVITSIGYDIRKFGGFASPYGSHCGAGAPRFNVVTAVRDALHRLRVAGAPTQIAMGDGWTRLAWAAGSGVPADSGRRRGSSRSTW